MRALFTWLFTAVVFTAVGGLGVWTYLEARGLIVKTHEAEAEAKDEHGGEKAESKPAVTRSETGEVTVSFDEATQRRMGVRVEPLKASRHLPTLLAYGVLQEDPAAAFILRAPIAGFVREREPGSWPHIGQQLQPAAVVGMIEPRLSPVERADLASRLANARAEVDEARVDRDAAKSSYESKKKLNEQGSIVSSRVLEEAEAKYKNQEARLKAAEQTVKVFESSLNATTGPAGPQPLTITRSGLVTQLLAAPGEAVEAGQILLQTSDFSRLLARAELPVGSLAPASVTAARVIITGHEDKALPGERVALAGSSDARVGGQTLLFRIQPGDLSVQPGMPVTVFLQLQGTPRDGVLVPRSAVVRFAGRAWVYVRAAADQFARREIDSAAFENPEPDGLFVAGGLTAGQPVVTAGAQGLLAEELTFGTKEEE